MRRRGFLALAAAAAWPALVWAQPKRARLGVLVVANTQPFVSLLTAALRERGYVDGSTVALEVRSANGKGERLVELARELVRLEPDVLLGWQTPAAQALKDATTRIPIIMLAGDPLATGLVPSLARPGGNLTGVSATAAAAGGKMLELTRELLPSAKRVGILANATDPFTPVFRRQLEEAAPAAGLELRTFAVSGVQGFEPAFGEMVKWRADAVVVQPSLPRAPALGLALKHRLPAISPTRAVAEAGGLMSYAADTAAMYADVAGYVDKVLKGAKPGDLPVVQASRFELVINLKSARALGIAVPRSVLLRADALIE